MRLSDNVRWEGTMADCYIIDGYNVIYAWPIFEKLRETTLEHARDKLISILSEFAAVSGSRVAVVFDAYQVKGGAEHVEKIHSIEVYYTAQDETADSLIERLAGQAVLKGRVFVVTSDWDEQRIIFGQGAYRITPLELLKQVKAQKEEIRNNSKSSLPADDYLENRLGEEIRKKFEQWRRKKI